MMKNTFQYNNIITFYLAVIVGLAPFVVNYFDLPKGFELAKVNFLYVSILSGAFLLFINLISFKKINLRKKSIALLFLLLIGFLFSTFLSEFQNVALLGNFFREQGLFLHIVLLLGGVIAYCCVDEKNFRVILYSLAISATIQSLVAISQYSNLLSSSPSLVTEGIWINGTFGQANFFSTHQIFGLISLFFIIYKIFFLKKIRILFLLLSLIPLSLIIISIYISYSIFGWIIAIFTTLLVFFYFILKARIYLYFFIFLNSVLIIGTGIYLPQITNNFRIEIWKNALQLFAQSNIEKLIFGNGFDTLGEVFQKNGRFVGVIVDRGHNLFIDILMQTGIYGLLIFSYLNLRIFIRIKNIIENKELFFFFLLAYIFITKSFIHEYSVIHLATLFILLGGLLGIIKNYR